MTHVERKYEKAYMRWLLLSWAPASCCLLSIALAFSIIYIIDGLYVSPGDREKYWQIYSNGNFNWNASDITTIVSATLVCIRVVASSWSASVIWRCILILLQKEGLGLGQISMLTAIKLHPPWSWHGRYSFLVALVSLLMFPSSLSAPLLTGSIDWKSAIVMEAGPQVTGGFGSDRTEWNWFFDQKITRKAHSLTAAIHGILPWVNSGSEFQTTTRYLARDTALNDTIVYNISMPYIEVHKISWGKSPWDNKSISIANELGGSLDYIGDDPPLSYYNPGSAVLFSNSDLIPKNPDWPQRDFKSDAPIVIPAKPITMMVIMLVSRPKTQTKCILPLGSTQWGDISSMELYGYGNEEDINCYAIGTVNLTASIRIFSQGLYVSERAVESRASSNDTTLDDPWAHIALRMLPHIMGSPTMAYIQSDRNITDHTHKLIIRSYVAARSVLAAYPPVKPNSNATEASIREAAPKLSTKRPVLRLRATVAPARVYSWLGLNILFSMAGVLLAWIEQRCARRPIIDPGLAALLTDSRDVLRADDGGISNMSYVTEEDKKLLGKIKLSVRKREGNELFGLECVKNETRSQD